MSSTGKSISPNEAGRIKEFFYIIHFESQRPLGVDLLGLDENSGFVEIRFVTHGGLARCHYTPVTSIGGGAISGAAERSVLSSALCAVSSHCKFAGLIRVSRSLASSGFN